MVLALTLNLEVLGLGSGSSRGSLCPISTLCAFVAVGDGAKDPVSIGDAWEGYHWSCLISNQQALAGGGWGGGRLVLQALVVWVLGLVSWVLGPQGTTSPHRTPT